MLDHLIEAMQYQYVVIRAVPRVEREEFINVAVVACCASADFLAITEAEWETRLRILDPDLDPQHVKGALRGIAHTCEAPAGHYTAQLTVAERFELCSAPRSTIIQPSPTHVGVTRDPTAALATLFERYIAPPTGNYRRLG